jgi:hypothetical protein
MANSSNDYRNWKWRRRATEARWLADLDSNTDAYLDWKRGGSKLLDEAGNGSRAIFTIDNVIDMIDGNVPLFIFTFIIIVAHKALQVLNIHGPSHSTARKRRSASCFMEWSQRRLQTQQPPFPSGHSTGFS